MNCPYCEKALPDDWAKRGLFIKCPVCRRLLIRGRDYFGVSSEGAKPGVVSTLLLHLLASALGILTVVWYLAEDEAVLRIGLPLLTFGMCAQLVWDGILALRTRVIRFRWPGFGRGAVFWGTVEIVLGLGLAVALVWAGALRSA